MRLTDGDSSLGTRRVDDADGAEVDQVMFQPGRLIGVVWNLRVGRQGAARHAQGAQRGVGHRIHVGQDACTRRVVQCHRLAAHQHLRASRQHHVGRALDKHHMCPGVGVVNLQRGHHLALRGERNLANPLVAFVSFVGLLAAAQLAYRHQKSRLRGVTLHDPGARVVLLKLGVAGQTTPIQHGEQLAAQRPLVLAGDFNAIALGPPLRRIAHAGDVAAPRRRHHALNRHFAACQRAGLVRGNDRS